MYVCLPSTLSHYRSCVMHLGAPHAEFSNICSQYELLGTVSTASWRAPSNEKRCWVICKGLVTGSKRRYSIYIVCYLSSFVIRDERHGCDIQGHVSVNYDRMNVWLSFNSHCAHHSDVARDQCALGLINGKCRWLVRMLSLVFQLWKCWIGQRGWSIPRTGFQSIKCFWLKEFKHLIYSNHCW